MTGHSLGKPFDRVVSLIPCFYAIKGSVARYEFSIAVRTIGYQSYREDVHMCLMEIYK